MIPDDPIPPQFLHLFTSHKLNDRCNTAVVFLKREGRKMESVIGDGNCLFRSLSFLLCGDQGMHTKAREEIVHFIKENKHKFQPYLMQGIIDAHITNMFKLGTWGTQVEIIAAATLYQIPIYVASTSQDGLTYHWRKYSPLLLSDATRNVTATTKTHLELIHLDSCHFDPLVSVNPDDNSVPVIVIRHHEGGIL